MSGSRYSPAPPRASSRLRRAWRTSSSIWRMRSFTSTDMADIIGRAGEPAAVHRLRLESQPANPGEQPLHLGLRGIAGAAGSHEALDLASVSARGCQRV